MPTHTLLVLKSDCAIRADFHPAAPRELTIIHNKPRKAGLGIPDAVEALLSKGPRCGRKVWLLCEDLWTSTLSLPVDAVAGLGRDMLERAVAFEAEPLSGIPALDAALGCSSIVSAGGTETFWVAATEISIRDRVQAVVKQCGGKLAGMGHPGGVPVPLRRGNAKDSWQRMETWSRITLRVDAAEGAQRVQIAAIGLPSGRGSGSTSNWRLTAVQVATESLVSRQVSAAREANPGSTVVDLSVDADLLGWLRAWADTLCGAARVPLIAPESRPLSKGALATASVLAAALMLACCVLQYRGMTGRLEDIRKATAEAGKSAAELSQFDKKIDELRAELGKIETSTAQLEKAGANINGDLDTQRARLSALLSCLAESRPDDVLIQSIKSEGAGRIKIFGVAVDAAQADEFATRLSRNLKTANLEVEPILKQNQQLTDTGPWDFVLQVEPAPGQIPQLSGDQAKKAMASAEYGASNP